MPLTNEVFTWYQVWIIVFLLLYKITIWNETAVLYLFTSSLYISKTVLDQKREKKNTNGIHQEANRLIRTVTRSLREIYRGGRDRMKPQCLTCFLMCPMAQRSHLMWCQSALSTHFAWTHLVSNYSPASLAVFWFSTLPLSIPNRLRFCLLCCLPSVKKPRHLWSL